MPLVGGIIQKSTSTTCKITHPYGSSKSKERCCQPHIDSIS